VYRHSLTIDFSYYIPPEWTEDGSEVKKYNRPSEVDWAWLNLMYPSPEPTQFEQALSKCGIDFGKEHRESILRSYSEGEWERVRSEIERVSNPKANSKASKMWIVGWVLMLLFHTYYM